MASPTSAYQFAFNGWLFGGVGQGVQVLQVDGLEDVPTLRTQDESRGYADGMFSGRDFLNGRTITVTLQIMSDSLNPMQTYLQQLKQYLLSQQTGLGTLQLYLPNRGVQRVYARVRKRAITIDPDYVYGRAEAKVEFFCPDPRIYNDTATSSTIVANAGSVRTYSKTYNKTYSIASGGIGFTTVTQVGNYETWPTFSISGACGAPLITNVTTGQVLAFPTLTMLATDTFVVNTDLRTVVWNGGAARNLLSNTSSWFSLPPNVPTTFTLSAASGTPSATITFRDAFI